MLKIFKNNFKNKHNKNITTFSLYPLSKTRKRLLLVIPENTADRVFSVDKSKMPTEYREKGIGYVKELNISNV